MQTTNVPRQLMLAISLAACLPMATSADNKSTTDTTARSQASSTINPGAATRRQRERELAALKAMVRQSLRAVGDLNLACAGNPPKPRLDLQDPAYQTGLGTMPSQFDIKPDFGGVDNNACHPGGNHLMLAAAHAMLGASTWATSNPDLAAGLRFNSESPDELKTLQRGLANVMSAFKVPAKP